MSPFWSFALFISPLIHNSLFKYRCHIHSMYVHTFVLGIYTLTTDNVWEWQAGCQTQTIWVCNFRPSVSQLAPSIVWRFALLCLQYHLHKHKSAIILDCKLKRRRRRRRRRRRVETIREWHKQRWMLHWMRLVCRSVGRSACIRGNGTVWTNAAYTQQHHIPTFAVYLYYIAATKFSMRWWLLFWKKISETFARQQEKEQAICRFILSFRTLPNKRQLGRRLIAPRIEIFYGWHIIASCGSRCVALSH